MKTDLLIGAACGATAALAAVSLLFGAQTRMVSSADAFGRSGAYYVVGEKRFDWFRKSGQNCWGGHTLDGRCISAVYVSGGYWVKGPECDPPHKCDAHGFLIASPEAKRKVATSCPDANPLYVEMHGRCPASVDTLPKGRDVKQARCASKGSAVVATGGETPKEGPRMCLPGEE